MQAVQASSPQDARPLPLSPPRQKGSSLASIAISSFAAFRSQPPQPAPAPAPPPVALQSPVRRKPLPADSPIVGRFSADQFTSLITTATASLKETSRPVPGPLSLETVLAPPVSDQELFVPRNLDE